MACNFIKVGGANTACTENYSGVGSAFYLFNKASLDAKSLTPATDNGSASWTSGSFTGLAPVKIKVKANSGKVTSSSNPNGGGFNNVYTCVVANDMESMSALASAMNNSSDWGIMVPTGKRVNNKKEYIVLYDEVYDIEFQDEVDTGDAPDSDHGHTLTITQSNMLYALQKWVGDITEPTEPAANDTPAGA